MMMPSALIIFKSLAPANEGRNRIETEQTEETTQKTDEELQNPSSQKPSTAHLGNEFIIRHQLMQLAYPSSFIVQPTMNDYGFEF